MVLFLPSAVRCEKFCKHKRKADTMDKAFIFSVEFFFSEAVFCKLSHQISVRGFP